jgi:hypothetical protein
MTKKPKAARAKKKVPRGAPTRTKAPVAAKGAKNRAEKPATTPATAGPDSLDSFIEAAAQMLDLPVDPAWQPAVKMNLQLILRQASLFTDFALPDEAEPAPVFTA